MKVFKKKSSFFRFSSLSHLSLCHGSITSIFSVIIFIMLSTTLSSIIILATATVGLDTAQAQEKALGKPLTVAGILDVLILEDFERGRSEIAYYVREQVNNKFYKLKFKRKPPAHLQTGHRVTIKGHAQDRELWVDTLVDESIDVREVTNAEMEALPLTERRAAVLIVDLLDAKASSRYSRDQIATYMYTGSRSVDGLYREASIEQLSFASDTDGDSQPDIFGPFTIDYHSTSCDYRSWAVAAERAAEAEGIDLSLYQHRVFVLPHYSTLACSWSGIANVGCYNYCRAWIAEAGSPMVFAHELGHNLGMWHAGTDPDNDGNMNNTYGDYSDTMGSSRNWHVFNAPHIDEMNWYSAFPDSIITVLSSGIYDIAAIGIDPSTTTVPHILKINKSDSNEVYYLSYRQPISYDSSLSSTYTRAVNIHRHRGNGSGYTYFIKSLIDSDSFTDEINGITITQLNSSGDHAAVEIMLDNSCASMTPAVNITPASKAVVPGQPISYSISLRNNDSSACNQTDFELSYSGSVFATLSPGILTLAGETAGTAILEVETTSVADGTYTLEVKALDGDGIEPNHIEAGVGTALLTIDSIPPMAPSGLVGTNYSNGQIELIWDSSYDTNSGVASYNVYRNSINIANTTTTHYIDLNTEPETTYTYAVTAEDGAGNESISSNQVIITTGNGSAIHVADIDGTADSKKNYWYATVSIMVEDNDQNPVVGARVNGKWSGRLTGTGSCQTGSTGWCSIKSDGIHKKISYIQFRVDDVIHNSLTYDTTGNNDPDGDSNGTQLTVYKP